MSLDEKLELLERMRQSELRDTAAMLPIVEASPPAGQPTPANAVVGSKDVTWTSSTSVAPESRRMRLK